MATRQTDDGPLPDVPEHTGEPVDAVPMRADVPVDVEETWVFVKPDVRIVMGRLLAFSPVIAIAAVRVGAKTADGPGRTIGVLGVILPFLWVALLCTLRWANAGILLADGVLTVRNRWGFKVLNVPVSALTGLYEVGLVTRENPFNTQVVVTTSVGRPFMVNFRVWDEEGLQELWRRLPLPRRYAGPLEGPALRERFPGADWPWHHYHRGLSGTLLTAVLFCVWFALLV
ncbi:hypothetical protein [Streptomyces sp. NPDC007264]|uniref:hypothetical protein n=1 Tax=Streptomyces sp. NPDC007264 TaxID=3364777 RepID=UPI0036DA9E88